MKERGLVAGRRIAMAVCVLFLLFAAVAATALSRPMKVKAAADVWDGDLAAAGWGKNSTEALTDKPDEYVAIGDSTKVTAVTIKSAKALAYLAHEVYAFNSVYEGVKVTLDCDINLNNKLWIPIGMDYRDNAAFNHAFKGEVDGNNHIISGFNGTKFIEAIQYNADAAEKLSVTVNGKTVTIPADNSKNKFHYGLFGAIGNTTIKNLTVADFTFINARTDVALVPEGIGAIVGCARGETTVINCTAGTEKTQEVDIGGIEVAGGIIGRAYTSYNAETELYNEGNCPLHVENCTNYLNIGKSGDKVQKGGIVGFGSYHKSVKYINCRNFGDLIGGMTGGITSFIQQSTRPETVEIVNCYNEGNLTAESYSNGGIVGRLSLSGNKLLQNCINKGKIVLAGKTNSANSTVSARYAGGIAGDISSNCDVDEVQIENVYNYGEVLGAEIEDTGFRSYTGGIIGRFGLDEGNNSAWWTANQNRYVLNPDVPYDTYDDYPCKTVTLADVVNYGKVDVGGERGQQTFVGGLFGDQYSNRGQSQRVFVMHMERVVNVYGAVNDIDHVGNGNTKVKKEYKPVPVPESIKTATLKLENNGTKLVGIEDTEAGAYKVVIPNTVTEIADRAFFGLGSMIEKGEGTEATITGHRHYYPSENRHITEVVFQAGSQLTTIGELAFAGTDIKTVALPDSVQTVKTGAFASTQLQTVSVRAGKLSDGSFGNNLFLTQAEVGQNVSFGDYVFGNTKEVEDFAVIVSDATQYQAIVTEDFADYATYPVTIRYYLKGSLLDEETRLYKRGYGFDQNNSENVWKHNRYAALGTAYAGNGVWYASDTCAAGDELDIAKVDALLNAETYPNVINLYSNDAKVFIPRSDIEYDGTSYSVNQLNSLLTDNSGKISGAAVITKFVDSKGIEADSAPEAVCNAGVYTIQVTEDEKTYTFDINVARRKLDLGAPENLRWYSNERTNRSNYPDERGQDFESGMVGDSYVLNSIVNYAVRKSGESAWLHIKNHVGYTVDITDEANQHKIAGALRGQEHEINNDPKVAIAHLTANDNYELVFDGCDSRYGLDVTVSENGTKAVIKKTWYLQRLNNWFIGSNGDGYFVEDRVFADPAAFVAPQLKYADNQYEALRFDLMYKSAGAEDYVKINGAEPFTFSQFAYYLNSAMPVGQYKLIASSTDKVAYTPVKADGTPGETQQIDGAEQVYEFSVLPAGYRASQLAEIDAILKGITFKFDFDGKSHLLPTAARNAINDVFAHMDRPNRDKTVWGDDRYNDLYSEYELVFNVARTQIHDYVSESELTDAMSEPRKYTVYYAVHAKNRVLSVDGYDNRERSEYFFGVVNVRTIDIPTLMSKQYNGQIQFADVSKLDTSLYTVTDNGGTNQGTYPVTFTLIDPECYKWNGSDGAEATVSFEITKAANEFIEAPDVVRWIEGKYNAEENKFIGAAKFGEIVYVVTDMNDKVVYDLGNNIDNLAKLKAGTYILKATVLGNDNYNGLTESFTIRILEKVGMPWWGTFLIVVGVLLVVAAVLFILWKKGVIRLLSDKLILAIRTKATVDATIAAIRANKRAEEAKLTVARAKAQEASEARRAAAAAERAKPAEERAAALEEKARQATERAQRMAARAEAMRVRAESLRARAADNEKAIDAAMEEVAADEDAGKEE